MIAHETRAVLAACYPGGSPKEGQTCHTHTVLVDRERTRGGTGPEGSEVRVLCSHVRLASICDSGATDVDEPPTCPTCLRRDPRFPKVSS